MLDQRGQLLRAAVGFAGCSMLSYDRALCALRSSRDSWTWIGHVAVGMHRQGYDLQLTQYEERGWRATFYTTGMEHSPTSATGTGWERTPVRTRIFFFLVEALTTLLDPFVVCSAVGGVLGHHRKSGLAFIFGKSRRPCRSRRTISQLAVLKIELTFGRRATGGRRFVASVRLHVHGCALVSHLRCDPALPTPREFLDVYDLLFSGDSIKRGQCEHCGNH